uniref:V-set and transmembrane domain containing 4a n=1 Tax=Nothobranchius furzeri TaxID=105023 RepID=A0A8C6KHP1_NOTFU
MRTHTHTHTHTHGPSYLACIELSLSQDERFSPVASAFLQLTRVLDVCHTLNVTVTPGPAVFVTERENLTLSCLVSQRKRSNSVLILRWMGIKKMKLYGNYTRRFPQPKFHLYDDDGDGELYRLLILGVTGMDQGSYICRVQEIRKHKNTWRASSNGTSSIQLTGKIDLI